MRPPACVANKWGKGTTNEKITSSESAKELKDKVQQMLLERQKQDSDWFAPPSATAAATATTCTSLGNSYSQPPSSSGTSQRDPS